jgi:hypothetical protein
MAKKPAKRGGFGQTGRRKQTQKVFAKVAGPRAAEARRRAFERRKKNPRTVQAVATRTIQKGETFRIKV